MQHIRCCECTKFNTFILGNGRENADLIAIDHQMVCSGEGLEDNHPARVGGPFKQRVSQLRDVYIHLICALNQV